MTDLTGKVVLVTGGARGIGEGLVRDLRAHGADVVLNYTRSKDRAEAIADELGRDHVVPIGADMSDWRQLETLWNEAVAWKGGVDVLVNNAAKRAAVPIDAPTQTWDDHWVEAFRINLLATAHLSRFAIHHFLERGGGTIIGITARIAVRGDRPDYFHDGAAKGGMNSLLRGIARAYAKDEIHTFLICVGVVETAQARDMVDNFGREEMLRDIPFGEFGTPQDVATWVTFLSSGKCRYASGATIDVVGASFLH